MLEAGGSTSTEVVQRKVGNSGKKADSLSSLPKVLLVSGDDTAPCYSSIFGQVAGVIYHP